MLIPDCVRRAARRACRVPAVLLTLLIVVAPGAALAQARAAAAEVGLRPGDVVRLRIPREPTISGDYLIDERGIASLPLVGERRLTSRPVDSVRAEVRRAYAELLVDPVIEVMPLRRVRVTGAVRSPGLQLVDPTMSLGDVLAQAGGASLDARTNEVYVIPRDAGRARTVRGLGQIAVGVVASGDELHVPLRSGWARNSPMVVASTIGALAAVATTVLFVIDAR